MVEKVMLYVMAGEDESKDLQDQKDGRFYENTLADEGGTGQLAGYNNDFVDELTDTDERPAKQSMQQGNDASSEFANFGNEAEYTNQFGDDEADDDENFNGDDEDYDNDAEDFDGEDDYDDYDDYDDDEDDENNEKDEDGEGDDEDGEGDDEDGEGGKKEKKDKDKKGKGKGDQNKDGGKSNKKPKIDPYDGVIKWRPGQPITIKLLEQVWKGVSDGIEKVKDLTKAANDAVTQALNSMGPNLTLKLNAFIDKMSDNKTDTIGSLLKLVSSNGKRMLWGSLSAVKAIFDQQWLETTLIFALPTMLMTAISMPAVSAILVAIFTIAVPIINKKARKDAKNK